MQIAPNYEQCNLSKVYLSSSIWRRSLAGKCKEIISCLVDWLCLELILPGKGCCQICNHFIHRRDLRQLTHLTIQAVRSFLQLDDDRVYLTESLSEQTYLERMMFTPIRLIHPAPHPKTPTTVPRRIFSQNARYYSRCRSSNSASFLE